MGLSIVDAVSEVAILSALEFEFLSAYQHKLFESNRGDLHLPKVITSPWYRRFVPVIRPPLRKTPETEPRSLYLKLIKKVGIFT